MKRLVKIIDDRNLKRQVWKARKLLNNVQLALAIPEIPLRISDFRKQDPQTDTPKEQK